MHTQPQTNMHILIYASHHTHAHTHMHSHTTERKTSFDLECFIEGTRVVCAGSRRLTVDGGASGARDSCGLLPSLALGELGGMRILVDKCHQLAGHGCGKTGLEKRNGQVE